MESLNLEQLIQIENEEFLGGVVDPLDLELPKEEEPKVEETAVDDPQEDPIAKDPTPEETSPEDLSGFYSLFKEEGILQVPEDFEFDGTAEGFKKALEQTSQSIRTQVTQSLTNAIPEEFRQILAYVMAGGRDLDAVVSAFDPVDYDAEDLVDPDIQKQILYQYYKTTTSMPDEKIASMVSKLEKLGNLKEEVEDAVEYLQNFKEEQKEELVRKQQESVKQQEEKAKEFNDAIVKAIDTVDAIPAERKGKVRNFIYSQVTKANQTDTDFNRTIRSILSTPEHYVQLADILMDYDSQKGFTFERFVSKGKSAANTEFRRKLDEALSPRDKVSKTSSVKSDVSQIDWTKLLKQID